ncbi:helix-turn-helix transcriptional regulator [Mariniflexile litorale]|uniref:Helix-turn-helix transcriptional regulator n=1 Tax=Mariniflexile litorale TaxID=3045158 RepID=A0AAU7EGS4_9FLAO|nr:helix-turn-helix transcriptional regulator [Mariniflexile sp. KMM 9835]MDQ8210908.1 helix-turn-helix transcriptional regulator [Mariniflexile sp. KMM 9835]
MKLTGKMVYEVRKQKGISQEELAILAKVNLRTIQRLENEINEPRDTTINLICEALQIDQNDLKSEVEEDDSGNLIQKLINVIFLIFLNVTIASFIIYLTVYNNANTYSRIGAFFLCILLPYFIVSLTRNSTSLMRLIKFGTGFILLIVFLLFQVKIATGIFSGAIPFSLIGLSILFYGDSIPFKK